MRCKDCKYFRPESVVLGSKEFGDCENPLFISAGLYENAKHDEYLVYYSDSGEGHFFLVNQNFGCVAFEGKNEV